MNIFVLSILIGLAAGIIDILPMIIKKLDKRASISAFLQCLFLGIIIVNIDLPYIIWWLEGGLISLAFTLPIVLIVSKEDKKSVPIIMVNSIILGTLIGIAGHFF